MLKLRPRTENANKSDFPKILAICGSHAMPGAAFLVCKSAFRLGAGYVYHYSPDGSDFLIPHLPECIPLSDLQNNRYEAVVIGPGLKTKTSLSIIKKVATWQSPTIVDATALGDLADEPLKLNSYFLLTPHEGEAAKLLNTNSKSVRKDKHAAAKEISQKYSCAVLLKGKPNILAFNNSAKEIDSGNASLASAGSGDVLAGLLACSLGHIKKIDEKQIKETVLFHGELAKAFTQDKSQQSLCASDLVEYIPILLKSWESKK